MNVTKKQSVTTKKENIMKEITIQRNTPTMPTKVAFYQSLVAFFKATTENPAITLNDEQKRAIAAINEFESGNTHIHYDYHVRSIDMDVVRKLTPKHHRKRNLYRILIAFFDSAISGVANATEVEEKTTTYKELASVLNTTISTMPVGVISFAVFNNVADRVKTVQENKGKKKYSVAVHATYVFDTEVVAESREEAERIAYQRAQESTDEEWAFVDYRDKGYAYDVEEL